jgi:predicted ArsR family transcriptional regulator
VGPTRIGQRFFSTTRGRILLLIRRSAHTVDELADLLGVTRTAVREHLATLERDGLVHRSGARRADGKPAHLYVLSQEAAELFRRGYAPVLRHVLGVIGETLPAEAFEALLREAGRRMASAQPTPRGSVRDRAAAAGTLLEELGGVVEFGEVDGVLVVQSPSCPLAFVVLEQPKLCRLMETVLAEVTGLFVRERCDRREPPRCLFEVTATDPARS